MLPTKAIQTLSDRLAVRCTGDLPLRQAAHHRMRNIKRTICLLARDAELRTKRKLWSSRFPKSAEKEDQATWTRCCRCASVHLCARSMTRLTKFFSISKPTLLQGLSGTSLDGVMPASSNTSRLSSNQAITPSSHISRCG